MKGLETSATETTSAEFEFDLCTDVVGVDCPLAAGNAFSGVFTWNGERDK